MIRHSHTILYYGCIIHSVQATITTTCLLNLPMPITDYMHYSTGMRREEREGGGPGIPASSYSPFWLPPSAMALQATLTGQCPHTPHMPDLLPVASFWTIPGRCAHTGTTHVCVPGSRHPHPTVIRSTVLAPAITFAFLFTFL